jgi:hypothetical protein
MTALISIATATAHPGRLEDLVRAEWYQVDDARITAITVVFDARPFTALTAAAPRQET